MTEVRPVAARPDSVRHELRELFDSFENVPELVKVLKVGEEFGEAAEAIIGLYAFNPRKGQNGDRCDVAKELADVAITAMVALHHFSPEPVQTVTNRLREVHARAVERAVRAETSRSET